MSARAIRVLDTQQMLSTKPPELDWLVEQFAARGHLTAFFGREKQGKSMLCQAIGATLANGGGQVAGLKVKAGKCLMLDAENAPQIIHRRVHGLGLRPEAAGRYVPCVPPPGFDLRKDAELIGALLDEHRPDLLVLDSFRSLWGGNENYSEEVAPVLEPFLRLAQSYAVAIVLIHHKGKSENDYRGSTAIGSTAEHLVFMDRVQEDPDRKRRKVTTRSRLDEEGGLWLRIDRDEEGIVIDEAEPFGSGDEERPKVTKAGRARALIVDFLADGKKHLARKAYTLGDAQGIDRATLDREARKLGVEKSKTPTVPAEGLWQLRGVGSVESVESGPDTLDGLNTFPAAA